MCYFNLDHTTVNKNTAPLELIGSDLRQNLYYRIDSWQLFNIKHISLESKMCYPKEENLVKQCIKIFNWDYKFQGY